MNEQYVRRDVVRLLAGVGVVGLAGCLGGQEETVAAEAPSPSTTAEVETPTPTSMPTPTPEPVESPTPAPDAATAAWAQAYGDAANTGSTADTGPSAGTIRWTAKLDGRLQAPPVVFGDRLFAVAGKTLHALARRDGSRLWTRTFETTLTHAPACTGEFLLVGADTVSALSPETGSTVWSSSVGASPATDLTVHDGVVYFGATDAKVYGLDLVDGAQVARSALFPHGGIQTPAAVDSHLFVTAAEEIVGLNGRGAQQWEYDTDATLEAPATVAGDAVYAATAGGDVRCLDRETGVLRWTTSLGGSVLAPPSVGDAGLFVVAGSTLHRLEAGTGRVEWSRRIDGAALTAVTQTPTALYVGSFGHRVFALEPETGAERWSKKTAHPVTVGPVVADDALYVATSDGTLYAF